MDLADTIRNKLNEYRAQPVSDSRLLIESAKRKGVISFDSGTNNTQVFPHFLANHDKEIPA